MKVTKIIIILSIIILVKGQFRRVNLHLVNKLEFSKNQWTNSRRTPTVPQLNCLPRFGNAGCPLEMIPDKVECVNDGVDSYGEVAWLCSAELDDRVAFSAIGVECEGFDFPGDKFVLEKSCALTFGLDWTEAMNLYGAVEDQSAFYLEPGKVMHFYSNQYTQSKRTKQIPQLNCYGGNAGCPNEFLPDSASCKVTGYDSEHNNFLWDCSAVLNENLDLGNSFVSCEGFRGPNDHYILKGSCGFFYELNYFDQNTQLLHKISALKFNANTKTQPKKERQQQQLQCKGYCPKSDIPTEITCYNLNHQTEEKRESNWYCEGNGNPLYVIDNPKITCEKIGTSFSFLPSCFLEYDFVQFNPDVKIPNFGYHRQRINQNNPPNQSSQNVSFFVILVIIIVLIACCCSFARKSSNSKKDLNSSSPSYTPLPNDDQNDQNVVSHSEAKTFNREEIPHQKKNSS
ncbi:hypothetical protein M0811_10223 [Anaeramoeba ignava]|uniref:Store-operated calcium entry-associated regulatory factor n=1 Tax=Anaeramoeba ignava TaxID=1746090 RepID=A0A9Q0R987_ANAIG|nr:hypothetical protein M0811_10223 [Anaeramoeba ignava]